jgi:general secretion pathway protein D
VAEASVAVKKDLKTMEKKMASRTRWLCLAALIPALAAAQFDFGGGATSDKPWESFHLNTRARVKLDFHSGASWDGIITWFENISGVTIVKDPSLTGTTSMTSARAVPLSDAFQIFSTTLSLKGYSLNKQGNLLVIKQNPTNRGGPQGLTTGTGTGNPFSGGTDNPFAGGGGNNQNELKFYKIVYANASALARTLNDVYTSTTNNNFMQQGGRFGGGPGGGGPGGFQNGGFNASMFSRQVQVRASSDDFSNSVIVNAPAQEQIQVKSLIDQLDKPSDLPLHTKVYHLTYEPASDAASIVQNVLTTNVPRGRAGATSSQTQGPQAFFNAIRGTTAGAGQVVADQRTNSIVVTAADDDLVIVDKVVQDLDKPVINQSTTFVFPLANARAESIATLLQYAFGTKSGTQSPSLSQLSQVNGQISTLAGTSTNRVSTSPNSQTSNRSGLTGQVMPDPSTAQYAMAYPTPEQQQAMVAQGQSYLPLQLADPNAQSGELLTSIGVTQGFPGGGGNAFRAQGSSSSSSQSSYTYSRNSTGQIVPTIDPTGTVTVIPDLNTNSILVVTTPETAQIIKDVIARLDKIPQQVEIQTEIVEATLDASSKLGVEWKFAQSLAKIGKDPTAVGTGGTSLGVASGNAATGAIPGFTYTIASKNLSFYLSALQTDSKFKVLSTPRILTTNNVQAQINVSQSIPYVTSVQTDSAGNPTYSYSFLNVGIILTVQPRITSGGMVTLDVDQTANELQGYQTIGNTEAPIVNQREAQSTVSVRDGETIILGGIISQQVTATVNKVPLLGDIPILGNLFKSTTRDKTRTELLVFMTPHVISNPDDAAKVTNDTIKDMEPEDQKDINRLRNKGNGGTTGGGTGTGTGGTGTGGSGTGNKDSNG